MFPVPDFSKSLLVGILLPKELFTPIVSQSLLFLSFISFIIASKGFDILYLFLLADLFCCAFVFTVFLSFYDKNINEKTAYVSIIIGLIGGFLMFPSPDFSKSLLVGILLPNELFAPFVTQSLLFLSFVVATFLPIVVFKVKKF